MKSVFVILSFVIVQCVTSLQNVRLMFPESVPEGGVATLFCLYDLEGEPLYSVKWYRGSSEIFRYVPKEKPKIRIFSVPGLYIHLNSSNAHRLILLDIPKHLGGNFTCEVSADAPSYTTRLVTHFLQVTRNDSGIDEIPNESYTKLSFNKSDNSTSGSIDLYKMCYLSSYLYSLICIIFIVK